MFLIKTQRYGTKNRGQYSQNFFTNHLRWKLRRWCLKSIRSPWNGNIPLTITHFKLKMIVRSSQEVFWKPSQKFKYEKNQQFVQFFSREVSKNGKITFICVDANIQLTGRLKCKTQPIGGAQKRSKIIEKLTLKSDLRVEQLVLCIDIESLKIDCLRFVLCPLLAPAFQW